MTSIDFPTQPAINLLSPRDVIEQKIWTSELWSGVSLLHLPSCVSALGRWYIMLVLNLVIRCFNILLHLTIKIRSFLLLLCAHSCLRCLSSSRSSLRSGPRRCMARTDSKKTLGKRCDVTGQVIVDKLATTFVPCDVEPCEVTRTVCNDKLLWNVSLTPRFSYRFLLKVLSYHCGCFRFGFSSVLTYSMRILMALW